MSHRKFSVKAHGGGLIGFKHSRRRLIGEGRLIRDGGRNRFLENFK